MNFRVSSRDLVLFCIFCVFLLLLCAIAVLNVTSLLNDGEFAGLNFFKAFQSPYLGATIVVFIAVLIAIFLSVSSYIFDKEGGAGISLHLGEKNDKGYSRWAKENEMKKAPGVAKLVIAETNSDAAGITLMNNGKEMWVDNGENHTLVIGATGSGKTTGLVDSTVQSLARNGESMILTDPKGEIYRNHSEMLRSKGYNIIVLNFRNPNLGNAWNPLSLPYQLHKAGNTDKATELLDDVALNILNDPNNKAEPFWEKSAADYFSGLSLGLFEDAKENQIHLNTISYMSTVGEEKFATSDYIKEYFLLKGESSSPYVFAANTINAPNETKGGILSVFRQKIRLFASREQLSEMLSYSDFNMRDIGKQKTAVFMIVHDEKTTYHALATIFIKQCYETLIDVAQENGGKLPFRTNFILDEFVNMPPLKDVTTMVTAARSRLIRFTFIIQNFAQLNETYGKENAETIRSNCGNLIYLITTELAALEEISKLCGEVKSKEKEKTSSTPLITVSDLQKMKMYEVIVLRTRLNPFKTKLTPSYEIDWGHNFSKGELVEREKSPIDLFDIKDFVKTKKRNKLFEALDNADKKDKTETEKRPFPPLFASPSVEQPSAASPSFPNSPSMMEPAMKPQPSFNPLNEPVSKPEVVLEPNPKTEAASLAASDVEQASKNTAPTVTNATAKPKYNVDDLVKRIDAKIAELEKLEEQEEKKEIAPVVATASDYDKLDSTIYEKFDDFYKADEVVPTAEEPIVQVDNESKIVGEPSITDDQYYDDFYESE